MKGETELIPAHVVRAAEELHGRLTRLAEEDAVSAILLVLALVYYDVEVKAEVASPYGRRLVRVEVKPVLDG